MTVFVCVSQEYRQSKGGVTVKKLVGKEARSTKNYTTKITEPLL